MNCSWLPYLTQRWCCERDHMRKGQIKNQGYSLTVKLCRYSPQVLLSLPTSISECCCLSEKKDNFAVLQNMNLKMWLCIFFFMFLTFGGKVIYNKKKSQTCFKMRIRQSDWYTFTKCWNCHWCFPILCNNVHTWQDVVSILNGIYLNVQVHFHIGKGNINKLLH